MVDEFQLSGSFETMQIVMCTGVTTSPWSFPLIMFARRLPAVSSVIPLSIRTRVHGPDSNVFVCEKTFCRRCPMKIAHGRHKAHVSLARFHEEARCGCARCSGHRRMPQPCAECAQVIAASTLLCSTCLRIILHHGKSSYARRHALMRGRKQSDHCRAPIINSSLHGRERTPDQLGGPVVAQSVQHLVSGCC